jgi:SAM-dependent methyltransferase
MSFGFIAALLTAIIVLLINCLVVISILESLLIGVPFLPVSSKVLPKILEALELKQGSLFVDLGCGDGRVMEFCLKQAPGISCLGLERGFIPFFLAKIRLRGLKSARVLRNDFFKYDLSGATHIFAYLSSGSMDKLLPKLEKELRPKTRLVSCDFAFSRKEPLKIIDLDRPKGALCRKLLVYEF